MQAEIYRNAWLEIEQHVNKKTQNQMQEFLTKAMKEALEGEE